jgi:lysophospholipase L1-like esterase
MTYPRCMTPAPRSSSGRRVLAWAVGAGAGAALLLTAVLGAWQPWRAPLAAPDAGSARGGTTADAPAPDALVLPADARVLVFGDSWTYGSAATDPTRGYAYVLGELTGWQSVVNGVRGSGYLKPGIDGPSFGERIATLDPALDPDLVIVQGSINDRLLVPDGYRAAVDAAWDALERIYPTASIVVLGPAPHLLPVDAGTATIDETLATAAAARGWWYISPLDEGWITESNYLDVIDTGAGRNHPSTDGHAYLAERLARALGERTAVTDAAADPAIDLEG